MPTISALAWPKSLLAEARNAALPPTRHSRIAVSCWDIGFALAKTYHCGTQTVDSLAAPEQVPRRTHQLRRRLQRSCTQLERHRTSRSCIPRETRACSLPPASQHRRRLQETSKRRGRCFALCESRFWNRESTRRQRKPWLYNTSAVKKGKRDRSMTMHSKVDFTDNTLRNLKISD